MSKSCLKMSGAMNRIVDYYNGKVIFVTGSTGFLGKFIIEKLLSSTNVSKIYLLIRNKRNVSAEERFESFKKDPIFTFRTPNHMLDRLSYITGDIRTPNLGLCPDAQSQLISNVQIVIHSAASVNFNEPLS